MIRLEVRTRSDVKKVLRRRRRQEPRNLSYAAAYMRRVMKSVIGKNKKPRAKGQPMTSTTHRAYKSIIYAVDKVREVAQIGPSYNLVGRSAMAHDQGTRFRGQRVERRPFRGKTLEKGAPKLASFWRGSI